MPAQLSIKDNSREIRVHKNRAAFAMAGIFLLALVLLSRMIYLQIIQHEHHITQSEKNRVHLEAIAPTRGLVYDRNGILLADNQPSYSVRIVKERTKNLDHTLQQLAQLIPITDDDLKHFQKKIKQRRRPYEAVPLRFHLTEEEIARIAVNNHALPGVEIAADLKRFYPQKNLSAHVIGYVGRINESELKKLDPTQYSATHYIGKLGVEQYYESLLHGDVGYQEVETNAHGRIMRVLNQQDPVPGKNLHLYLDAKLQKLATDLLADYRGAIVAIDPNTGGVLAFVSTPAYDPNLFVIGISTKNYSALRDSLDRPLFNRALNGQYPPGSTIKPFVGLAGLEHNITNWQYTISDPGWYQLENDERFYRDWKRQGHGHVNLSKAIIESCDTYFYELSFNLGIDRLHDFMQQFGFGKRTHIDLRGEPQALMPSSEWKKRTKGVPWFPGETLNAGIGQGFMLATPLQLATATAILANKGKVITPKLADLGFEQNQAGPDSRQISLKIPSNWDAMINAMTKVMHSFNGTARSSGAGAKYKIAGKTGTAQVVGIKQDERYKAESIAERHRDHALFVGFAPANNPQIALAVIVENGGGGGSTAAPMAREIFDAYLLSAAADEKAAEMPPLANNSEQTDTITAAANDLSQIISSMSVSKGRINARPSKPTFN